MSDTMVLNFPMFKMDTNLLSVISLIVVFAMVFSFFSIAVARNHPFHHIYK